MGEASLSDKARSKRPVTAKECIEEMIQENCQIKHKDTTLGISMGHIIGLVGF
jgi:hypothetical protein